jgi:hypothetical protein
MKKLQSLLLLFVCVCLCGNAAFAQAKNKKPVKPKTTKTTKPADKKTADVKPADKKKAGTSAKPVVFKERIAYIMSSQANIRKDPSTKAESLIKLAAGSEVKVVADGGSAFTIAGVKANWYKVNFRKDTTIIEGFVWGGYLSDLEMESARDKGVQFLFRRNNDTSILMQACSNGVLMTSITVTTKGCKGLSVRNKAGWDRVHDAIIINTTCNGMAYEDLVIWSGNKLTSVGSAESNATPGTDPFHEEHWIIEAEKGAKRDAILKEKTDRIEWDGAIYRNAQSAMQRFEWNGTDLVEK